MLEIQCFLIFVKCYLYVIYIHDYIIQLKLRI